MTSELHQPLSGNVLPRFGGIATMMRLPHCASTDELDAAFVGVPLDIGTSNRSGARFGPRQIRAESVLLRPYNMATRAAPFDSMRVADVGDVATNPYSLLDSVRLIEEAYDKILRSGCRPISLGGDHTMALPILRAMRRKLGPVGLIHGAGAPRSFQCSLEIDRVADCGNGHDPEAMRAIGNVEATASDQTMAVATNFYRLRIS